MKLIITLLFALVGYFAYPQSPQSQFSKEYIPIWESARRITMDLAEKMPANLYPYKPTEEMKTFGEQMVHIGHTIQWMYDYLIEGKTEGLPKSPNAAEMTKQEIIDYLSNMFDQGSYNIRNHPVADLDRKVNYFGEGEITIKWTFISIQDHLVNHRAKANLYFRLNGLEPPEYNYVKGLGN
ncbi:MAG: DinB family protein [Cyclobacteriaceae bacterium]